ncbi:MAG: hypothetical protein IJ219_05530 [Bacteroidaceae bacterium]|nr:hypothetical protein [Bacteroidaceae bacterium]MBQ9294374.1 hypothetical protein [Bacteroidaceae bacterium]
MKHLLLLSLLLLLSQSLRAENWMKRLPDDAYVANLSIPGSHDTGTGNGFPGITVSIYGPFGDKYARTQEKSFQDQWELGVRAFDMRPAVKDGYLNDNHGIMPTKLRFDDALFFLRDKLRENPSEFAIVHLLHATAGDDNASNYGDLLLQLLGRDDMKDYFIDFKKDLTVREMRGKILLLSRDQYADTPVGGFFRNWTGQLDWNAQRNGQIVGASGTASPLYMQDFAETHQEGALDRKVAAVRQLLDFSTKHKTSSAADLIWVYNFASAYSKTSRLYIPFIVDQEISSSDGYRDNAAHTNAAIIDYLNDASYTPGPTGIILADYVGVNSSNGYNTRGQELIDAIIANNFRYLKDMYQVSEGDATYRKPIDMSARIANPCFNNNLLTGWNGDQFGAVNPKENAEHFDHNFNTHQTLTDMPNGVYAVSAKGFYRAGVAEEANRHYRIRDLALRNARIYAASNRDTLTFPLVSPFSKSVVKAKGVGREIGVKNGSTTYYIPDDMIAAEYYMHDLNTYDNKVFIAIDNHTLSLGVMKKKSAGQDWCVFDDFTLTYYGNQAEAYQTWMNEMKKRKLSYTSVTVSKDCLEAYNNAFSTAKASNRMQAIAAMRTIDALSDLIAINAELWAEYKQVGAEAEAMLNDNQYSEDAKAFLRGYYQTVYQANLSALELSNSELPAAIEELREHMRLVDTGEWTGIAHLQEETNQPASSSAIFTLDGRRVSLPLPKGIYIRGGRKYVVNDY